MEQFDAEPLNHAGSKVQQLQIGGKELLSYFGTRARAGKVVETKLKELRFE